MVGTYRHTRKSEHKFSHLITQHDGFCLLTLICNGVTLVVGMIQDGFKFLAKECVEDIEEVLLLDLSTFRNLRWPILHHLFPILVFLPKSFDRDLWVIASIDGLQDWLGYQFLWAIEDATDPLLIELVLWWAVELRRKWLMEQSSKIKMDASVKIEEDDNWWYVLEGVRRSNDRSPSWTWSCDWDRSRWSASCPPSPTDFAWAFSFLSRVIKLNYRQTRHQSKNIQYQSSKKSSFVSSNLQLINKCVITIIKDIMTQTGLTK